MDRIKPTNSRWKLGRVLKFYTRLCSLKFGMDDELNVLDDTDTEDEDGGDDTSEEDGEDEE